MAQKVSGLTEKQLRKRGSAR